MSKRTIQKADQKPPKYKIEEYRKRNLSMFADYPDPIKQAAEFLGINTKTFQRDREMTIDSVSDIPVARLRRYAQAFGIQILDLCNEVIHQKSFEQLIKEEEQGIQSEIDSARSEFELD